MRVFHPPSLPRFVEGSSLLYSSQIAKIPSEEKSGEAVSKLQDEDTGSFVKSLVRLPLTFPDSDLVYNHTSETFFVVHIILKNGCYRNVVQFQALLF